MARPIKNYCDYFPHDRDMRNHRKVKAIRTKFGVTGYAIWSMILESFGISTSFSMKRWDAKRKFNWFIGIKNGVL